MHKPITDQLVLVPLHWKCPLDKICHKGRVYFRDPCVCMRGVYFAKSMTSANGKFFSPSQLTFQGGGKTFSLCMTTVIPDIDAFLHSQQ